MLQMHYLVAMLLLQQEHKCNFNQNLRHKEEKINDLYLSNKCRPKWNLLIKTLMMLKGKEKSLSKPLKTCKDSKEICKMKFIHCSNYKFLFKMKYLE